MKCILVAVTLALLPVSSDAMRVVSVHVPVLHSIFDNDTPKKNAQSGIDMSGEDGWSRRFSAGPPRMPEYIHNSRPSREQLRHTGIGLMIAGGIVLAGGTALLLYANDETQRQQANGGRSYTSTYYILAVLIFVIGAVLTLVGAPIWLTNLGPVR